MGIIRNLQKMHVAVVLDTFNESEKGLGRELAKNAIAALTNGFGSDEWKRYMSLFADNEEQLKRLSEESDDDEDWFPESRAYMVANAVCGAGTTGQTGLTVTTGLGEPPAGVANFDAVDAEFIANRPFVVPDPEV